MSGNTQCQPIYLSFTFLCPLSSNTRKSYTEKEIRNITVAHREAKCLSDKIALGLVRLLRWCTDFVTGYRNPERNKEIADKFDMTERKWLIRFIFLESVAGVPGMVGGMLRHLKSIRRMKRDHGWSVQGKKIIISKYLAVATQEAAD